VALNRRRGLATFGLVFLINWFFLVTWDEIKSQQMNFSALATLERFALLFFTIFQIQISCSKI
jgi:hypothetical protein